MATGVQLSFEDPVMALLAARNTPYNSTAHALAELVDNSIDARARLVDLLLLDQREKSRSGQSVSVVRRMAVMDDGHGMTPEVLQLSLRRGGRAADLSAQSRRIGKYGVGLPTASLSQCQRVDVWSWQEGIDSAWHAYLDVDEVVSGQSTGLLFPYREPLETVWLAHCRDELAASESGTLVVWSQMDQVDWRTSGNTMDRVEEVVGRIYRYFLQRNELSIAMQAFNVDEGTRSEPRIVRPNDPLYLMSGTPPPHWPSGDSMFEVWGTGKEYTFKDDEGLDHLIEVQYSMVKPEVLVGGSTAAGSTPHGRAAARNVGISVVREDRELMTLPPLNHLGDTRLRWFGCEIRFGRSCDDLFGVDHSKQLAARLRAVHGSVQRSSSDKNTDVEEDRARIESDGRVLLLYDIVRDINTDTDEIMKKIIAMRKPTPPVVPDVPGSPVERPDISSGATVMATRDIAEAVDEGLTDPTDTEQERRDLTAEDVAKALAVDLAQDGLEESLASEIARWAGNNGVGFVIVPGRVSGTALFDVRNDHGTVRVVLNQEHRLFRVLNVLSDPDEQENLEDIEIDGQAMAHLLYLLLCAWARMFEHTPGVQARQRLENVVSSWGSEATYMLNSLAQQLVGDEE